MGAFSYAACGLLPGSTCKGMQQRLRLAGEVVEFEGVGGVCGNDGNNVGVVVLVVALALKLVHVAAANDGVGGEHADAAEQQGAGVAGALVGVVVARVAAVGIPE